MSKLVKELQSLVTLYEQGVLSTFEFRKAKVKLLSSDDSIMAQPSLTESLSEHGWFSGSTVKGYRLSHIIGKGTYGVVWGGVSSRNTPVALKAVHIMDHEQHTRILHEVEILQQLNSHNIVRLYECFAMGEWLVLVLEHVDGITLNAMVNNLTYELSDIDDIAHGLMNGLEAIHQHNLIHRDIKPNNILLTYTNNCWIPKIIDFGIAKRIEQGNGLKLTQAGVALGTPGFMSPEQFASPDMVDERADIFALGAVLYFLSTRKRAFRGSSHIELIRKSGLEQFELPEKYNPDLPERITNCIRLSLSEAVNKRPQNIDAFRAFWSGQTNSVAIEESVSTFDMRLEDQKQHLPIPTKLFGRGGAVEQLRTALQRNKLVQITGPSGIGKSALATNYAHYYASFVGRCTYINLEANDGIYSLYRSLAQSLNILTVEKTEVRHILGALKHRGEQLLIVDGGGQVSDEVVNTVNNWLIETPNIKWLFVWCKANPMVGSTVSLGPISHDAALDLFATIAQQDMPFFEINSTNREAISEVIECMDGVPLAIELIAPHIAHLRPALLKQLIANFLILEDTDEQNKMIRAVAWSFNMLKPHEQAALMQFSIFKDSFDLEAAEFVVDLSEFEKAPMVMDVLHDLERQGWLHLNSTAAGERIFILDSVLYVVENMGHTITESLKLRFARYYAQMGFVEFSNRLTSEEGPTLRHRLELDHGNLLVALAFAKSLDEVDLSGFILLGINNVLQQQGSLKLANQMFESFSIESVKNPSLKRDLYSFWGGQLDYIGHFEKAEEIFALSLAVCKEHGLNASMVHHNLGFFYHVQGRYEEAEQVVHASMCEQHQRHLISRIGKSYNLMGLIKKGQRKFADAEMWFKKSVETSREQGNLLSLGGALSNYATLLIVAGRFKEASELLHEAREAQLQSNAKASLALTFGNLGSVNLMLGEYDIALNYHKKALEMHRYLGRVRPEGLELLSLARAYIKLGEWTLAKVAITESIPLLKRYNSRYSGVSMMGLAWLEAREGLPASYSFDEAYELSKARMEALLYMLYYAGLYHVACQDFVSAALSLETAEAEIADSGLDDNMFWNHLFEPLREVIFNALIT